MRIPGNCRVEQGETVWTIALSEVLYIKLQKQESVSQKCKDACVYVGISMAPFPVLIPYFYSLCPISCLRSPGAETYLEYAQQLMLNIFGSLPLKTYQSNFPLLSTLLSLGKKSNLKLYSFRLKNICILTLQGITIEGSIRHPCQAKPMLLFKITQLISKRLLIVLAIIQTVPYSNGS